MNSELQVPPMNRAYLSVGSNIAPEKNLPDAVRLLCKYGKLRSSSSVWESPPIKGEDQPNYLNAAVILDTPLSAATLRHQAIAHIETLLGRVRHPHDIHAPRTIDIDIMLFNHNIIRLAHRQIPDAEIFQRGFVAITLAELDPEYIHPQTGQTLAEIAGGFIAEDSQLTLRSDVQLIQQKGKSTTRV